MSDAFFEHQGKDGHYRSHKSLHRPQDEAYARILNERVTGEVLTVGGAWDHFKWLERMRSLTVLDSSPAMLASYAPAGAKSVVGDLFEHAFAKESFDTVVFPLMLHHTAQGSWGECEERIGQAIGRARDWLKPGGEMLIVEHCPSVVWYPIQRGLLPATRIFMRAVGQPFVVLHTARFFERVLKTHFPSCETRKIVAPGMKSWTLLPVFLSALWVKLPFFVYPKIYVFSARKPFSAPSDANGARKSGPTA